LEPTRILLAVRPRMLCETLSGALRERLGGRANIVALESWRDVIDLAVAVHDHEARVLVMTVCLETRLPRSVARLLDECSGLLVLALDPGAELARTYRRRLEVRSLPELSVAGLVDALRGVVADDRDRARD
jgi:hypothetical protein